jgi:hypothetical protein
MSIDRSDFLATFEDGFDDDSEPPTDEVGTMLFPPAR